MKKALYILCLFTFSLNSYSSDSTDYYFDKAKKSADENILKAIKLTNIALDNSIKNNRRVKEVEIMIFQAIQYEINGDKSKSLDILFNALKKTKLIKGKDQKVKKLKLRINNNIGINYAKNGMPKKSLSFFKKTLELSKNIASLSDSSLASYHNNLGGIYLELKDFRNAKSHLYMSINYSKNVKHYDLLNIAYGNIAELYQETGELDSAIVYFDKLLVISNSVKGRFQKAHAYYLIGKYYSEINEIKKAILYVDSAIYIAKDLAYNELLLKCYLIKSDLLEKSKSLRQASQYLSKFIVLSDSLFKQNYKEVGSQNQFSYKIKKESKQQLLIQNQNKIEQQEQNFIILILVSIVVIVVLVALLFFYMQLSKTKSKKIIQATLAQSKQNISTELISSEKEIEMIESEEKEKQLFINEIIDFLNAEKEKFKPENKKILNSIIKDLKVDKNKNLEEFNVRFNQTDAEFKKTLFAKFPNLTPNEKKICAFVYQGLSSREISELTGQTKHSVEVARTRLRKKIGLSNTNTSLKEYLNQLYC